MMLPRKISLPTVSKHSMVIALLAITVFIILSIILSGFICSTADFPGICMDSPHPFVYISVLCAEVITGCCAWLNERYSNE